MPSLMIVCPVVFRGVKACTCTRTGRMVLCVLNFEVTKRQMRDDQSRI